MDDILTGIGPIHQRVAVAAAGEWADLPPFVPAHTPAGEQAENGNCFWLSDTQVNLTGAQPVWLTRFVLQVVDAAGLHEAGQVDLDFDPNHQSLVFHHVRVIRDGHVREVDPQAGLSVWRRERDLERARYDGRLTAHLTIPDLRVGDIVDVARSTVGSPPLFGGRFAAEFGFDWSCWVGETRVRVLAHPDRDLVLKSWCGAPQMESRLLAPEVLERSWRSRATAARRPEPEAATWERVHATVQAADALSWAEVADVFRVSYAPQPLPPELEDEVAPLVSQPAGAQVVALLRLVQGALRYQSIAIGEGGFVPRSVDHIWANRAGDCKDASRLLTSLMRRLDLDATPVLVNTLCGWVLDQEAPNLTAFDHCIVRVQLDGETYWLDPTRYPQGGDLEHLHQARFGWALPLVAGAELQVMGREPVRATFTTEETYELGPSPTSAATLTVRTVYGAWRADSMRRALSVERSSLTKSWLEFYGRHFGGAEELQPVQVSDDLATNELVTLEQYSLKRPWTPTSKGGAVEFCPLDSLFSEHLTAPRTAERRTSLDLGLPRQVSAVTTIRLPRGLSVDGWDRQFGIDGLNATHRLEKLTDDGREIRVDRTLTVEPQFLSPGACDAFFDFRDELLRTQGVAVTMNVRDGRFVEGGYAWDDSPLTTRAKLVWSVIVVVLVFAWLYRTFLQGAP